jgi:hypothetical protein
MRNKSIIGQIWLPPKRCPFFLVFFGGSLSFFTWEENNENITRCLICGPNRGMSDQPVSRYIEGGTGEVATTGVGY